MSFYENPDNLRDVTQRVFSSLDTPTYGQSMASTPMQCYTIKRFREEDRLI
jgi:hypothetical protein